MSQQQVSWIGIATCLLRFGPYRPTFVHPTAIESGIPCLYKLTQSQLKEDNHLSTIKGRKFPSSPMFLVTKR